MGNCSSSLIRRYRRKRNAPDKTLGGLVEQPLQTYGASAYELVGQLGSGKSGTMKLLKNRKTGELVAAKYVERVAGAGLSKNTEREIVNHRRLLHHNIIRFYEVYMTEEHLVIVMEYASGGTLEQRIEAAGPLPEEKARDLFLQLVSALEYCHSRSIYHRDLRLQNLHLHGSHFEPQLKLTGFGYSKSAVLDSQPKTNVGSPSYTPPELLMFTRNEGAAYDGASNDVWSAGVILYHILTGSMPFEDPATPGALNRKMMQKIVNVEYTFPATPEMSRECKDFISKIFVKDPKERIRTIDMRRHPWLAGTTLPTDQTVNVSPQSELEIHEIVEKARQRRRNSERKRKAEQANGGRALRANASLDRGEAAAPPSAPKMLERRQFPGEDGIAEVPKQTSLPRTRSKGVKVTG